MKSGEKAMTDKLVVFKNKEIRRTLHNNEWWFSVADVVAALTGSVNAADYIKKMRRRDSELNQGWGQIVTPLWLDSPGGKQKANCANTEGLFRIIQSIPSPKAEPFKRWLAKVGYERVQEIEDLELASKRTKALYLAKGYSASGQILAVMLGNFGVAREASIMIPGLEEVDTVVADEVNEAVFLGETARPDTGGEILERFRLADAAEGIAHDRFDQVEGAQGHLSVGFDPVVQVVTEFRLENGLATFTPQGRCPCAVWSRWMALPRV